MESVPSTAIRFGRVDFYEMRTCARCGPSRLADITSLRRSEEVNLRSIPIQWFSAHGIGCGIVCPQPIDNQTVRRHQDASLGSRRDTNETRWRTMWKTAVTVRHVEHQRGAVALRTMSRRANRCE